MRPRFACRGCRCTLRWVVEKAELWKGVAPQALDSELTVSYQSENVQKSGVTERFEYVKKHASCTEHSSLIESFKTVPENEITILLLD